MKRKISLPLALAVLSANVQADRITLSATHSTCLRKAETTAHQAACNGAEIEVQKKRLNAAYARLMKATESAGSCANIEAAQRAWLTWREQNARYYEDDADFGTGSMILASSFLLHATAERATELGRLADLKSRGR